MGEPTESVRTPTIESEAEQPGESETRPDDETSGKAQSSVDASDQLGGTEDALSSDKPEQRGTTLPGRDEALSGKAEDRPSESDRAADQPETAAEAVRKT
jgi:hypothetical protein